MRKNTNEVFTMLSKFDLPPVWLILHILAVLLLVAIFPWPQFGGSLARLLSLALTIAAAALVFLSVRELRRHGTTVHPHHRSRALCRQGPFRYSRHPIYLAMLIVLLSVIIWSGAIVGLAPLLSLFVVLDRRFARPEEARVRERFPDYEDYRQVTRRWL